MVEILQDVKETENHSQMLGMRQKLVILDHSRSKFDRFFCLIKRLISLNMQKRTTPKIPFSKDRTRLLADWGQFITHDMIQTPDMAGGGPDPCNCVREDVCDNIATPKDPVIDFHCFFVVKSIGKIGRTGPNRVATKEQVNQLSGFMDGTQIYGFTNEDRFRKCFFFAILQKMKYGATDLLSKVILIIIRGFLFLLQKSA